MTLACEPSTELCNYQGDRIIQGESTAVASTAATEVGIMESNTTILIARMLTILGKANRPGLRKVQVALHESVLVLSGQVRSFHDKQLAAEICRQEAGRFQIANNIIVVDVLPPQKP